MQLNSFSWIYSHESYSEQLFYQDFSAYWIKDWKTAYDDTHIIGNFYMKKSGDTKV